MNANICCYCMTKVRGTCEGLTAALNWSDKCVCGGTAVFYARVDELHKAKENLQQILNNPK